MFRTSDTALAAFLVTQGFPLSAIDYSSPRYEFVFDGNIDEDLIKEASQNYQTSKALVDPATYNRILKTLLRTVRDRGQWQ
ncbi:hypothetical protein LCGC14_1439780 [marine sediment metagenome]|uniref:DUF5659 domain-containing protein n=1 Tax=marine sediment metagenome TaxID=412755 RepID=A0A0F9JL08_9ZZZZ